MSSKSADLAPLVVILGPTASGKSALGIELAKRFNGEVIVCDSTQVYRRFDIGTAKVPLAEQRGITHHLTDLVEPDEVFTAGEYRRRAISVLDDLRCRAKLPVLTAGTGLYLRALLEGLADAPERSEELRSRLREIAQRNGPEHLHRLLRKIDREASQRIAVRDTQKVVRAIEICMLAQQTVGDVHRSGREPLQGFRIVRLGLAPDRKALYTRIEARTRQMIVAGWVDEVRRLIAGNVSLDAKPFQFIGYTEVKDHLEGKISKEETVMQIQQATRQFAKRQMTWFRREPDVHWLTAFGDDPAVIDEASAIVAGVMAQD